MGMGLISSFLFIHYLQFLACKALPIMKDDDPEKVVHIDFIGVSLALLRTF